MYSNWLSAVGTILDNRNFGNSPRVGFNGKEKDSETVGTNGNTYDYGFRIYNPSLGRFLSVDPLFHSFVFYTPFQFAGNKPIWKIDLDGAEESDSKANSETDQATEDNKNVVVDAGHGGDDPGTTKKNGSRNEEDVTLKVAQYTNQRLAELNKKYNQNVSITMTRTDDKNPGGKGQDASLKARVKISKDAKADLFVSIHVDAAASGTADKVTVYTKTSANEVSNTLANNIVKALTGVAMTTQGVTKKEASHHVTREQDSKVGAALVEIGYMTNEAQEKLFNDDAYLQKLGNALGDAIFQTAYPTPTVKEEEAIPFVPIPTRMRDVVPDALKVILTQKPM